MASLNSFADALKAAAAAAPQLDPGERKSFEEILSNSLRDALDRINSGSVDSYDFGLWVISNIILLADIEGYELTDTMGFLRIILD